MRDWAGYRKGLLAIALLAAIAVALFVLAPVPRLAPVAPVSIGLYGVVFLCLYAGLVPPRLLRSFGRVLYVFPPFWGIGVGAVWMIWAHAADADKARIYPGLITGLIVVLGWFVTFVISSYREAEQADRIRRDTLVAIKNEIFALVDKMDNVAIRSNAQLVQGRIASGVTDAQGKESEYFPFATMESEPIVFEALGTSVPGLEEATVAAVVRFYAEYTDLRRMVEDSRTEDIKRLPRDRRVNFHKQLTKRRIGTLTMGLKALVEINFELGIEDPENIGRSGENPEITP